MRIIHTAIEVSGRRLPGCLTLLPSCMSVAYKAGTGGDNSASTHRCFMIEITTRGLHYTVMSLQHVTYPQRGAHAAPQNFCASIGHAVLHPLAKRQEHNASLACSQESALRGTRLHPVGPRSRNDDTWALSAQDKTNRPKEALFR